MTQNARIIRFITELDEARRIFARGRGFEQTELSPRMREGIRRVFGQDLSAEQVVDRILADVRHEGDSAVRRYTEAIDGAAPAQLEVPRSEWDDALHRIPEPVGVALEISAQQIEAFH